MAKRLPNPRLAKVHRNYTVEEVATLYGKHRNTVRAWIKDGLATCDARRPLLILGSDLAHYLTAKRNERKRPCKPGELYCMPCRRPQMPSMDMADYMPLTATSGNFVGICPCCETLMNRRVSLAKLDEVRGHLQITLPKALRHIDESCKPSVNSDFKIGAVEHAKAQRR